MDMVFQIIHHLLAKDVQTGPAAASAFGKLKIVGQFLPDARWLDRVLHARASYADGHCRAATTP